MKRRGGLVLSMFALSLAFCGARAGAGTLEGLFKAATESNQDYSMYKIDLDLAQLKKTKGEIEAKVELDRANAQAAYVQATADYRKSVLGFYNQVMDAVFAAATAELDLESVGLSLENASEDMKYAESRFKNGLISDEVLKEIGIAYKTVAASQEFAAWTLKDARDAVRLAAGLEWSQDLLPEVPEFSPDAKAEEWIAADTSLQKAVLAGKIAELKTSSLATNASVYDRKIQETENLRAKVAASTAESSARRAFESAVSTIKNQAALLQIRKDEYALKELDSEDALKQYRKGIISLGDKNAKAIAVLTARKNLLAAEKNYLKSIGSYLSSLGENPLGI